MEEEEEEEEEAFFARGGDGLVKSAMLAAECSLFADGLSERASE